MGEPLLQADDLKAVCSFSHETKNVQNCIRMEFNKVAQWYSKWQLELNTAKCGWMCFCNTSLKLDFTINGKVLSNSGLRYSYNLPFTEQVSNRASESHHLRCVIRNLYNESSILMCKVCVLPLLEYCKFILTKVHINDKLRLEFLQRRFTLITYYALLRFVYYNGTTQM